MLRHGHRNTIKEGGQLTELGRYQSWKKGFEKWEYLVDFHHLLSYDFNPNTITVITTDLNRTQETANAFLQGLYPF